MRGATLLGLLAFFSFFEAALADIFTSMAHMQSLLDTERKIPAIIQSYIEAEEKRLEGLRQMARHYEKTNDLSLENSLQEITNPVNAFLLIKRKIFDWREIRHTMTHNAADRFVTKITDSRSEGVKYPSDEDLSGSASALLRLQDTYRLDTNDLANGKVGHIQGNYTFSAEECFEIARTAYNEQDYYHTILWMEVAQKKLEKEEPGTSNVQLADILEYLAYALYKQGNLKKALQLTEELYNIEPDHPRAKGNVKWYEDLLEKDGVRKQDMRRSIPAISNPRPREDFEETERSIYEALCRQEVPRSPKEISKLYSYYKRDRPFLILAPIKVQIVHLNPLAVLFKEVVSDSEIAVIQELATPKLMRATVQDSKTGKLVHATYRISKSAWLKGWEHEVVDRVNRRLDLMTNLEMETAEELQIANYGIGGHYDPHFDHARKEETKAFSDLGTGNRIATVLFYMSQPSQGGGTVFTELKATVMPSIHDALFWYNLRRSGEPDERTRHAACPVLTGVKWVSNKWIHELDQDFRRPCGLKPSDGERFVGDQGGPEPRFHPNFKS